MSERTAGQPEAIEDEALVLRAQAGHTDAFGQLVRRYQDRVFNTVWRICGHYDDAVDVTQDAFTKAFEGLAGFRGESGFYTWLFRVAVNLALSQRRKSSRNRTVSLDASVEVMGTQAQQLVQRIRSTAEETPDERARRTEAQARVVRALEAMDDDHRTVVVLRDMEGFDYREIGKVLGIPPGTVKSRLHRARMEIRAAL